MTESLTVIRALVVATLLAATATLMVVVASTARAAGALAVNKCGAYGEAYGFPNMPAAKASAMSKCTDKGCKVVITLNRTCAAFAVDYKKPCGPQGWASAGSLGGAQNAALKSCYRYGGKECVIRTFVCDARS